MIAKDIKQDIVILEFLETGIIMMTNAKNVENWRENYV